MKIDGMGSSGSREPLFLEEVGRLESAVEGCQGQLNSLLERLEPFMRAGEVPGPAEADDVKVTEVVPSMVSMLRQSTVRVQGLLEVMQEIQGRLEI